MAHSNYSSRAMSSLQSGHNTSLTLSPSRDSQVELPHIRQTQGRTSTRFREISARDNNSNTISSPEHDSIPREQGRPLHRVPGVSNLRGAFRNTTNLISSHPHIPAHVSLGATLTTHQARPCRPRLAGPPVVDEYTANHSSAQHPLRMHHPTPPPSLVEPVTRTRVTRTQDFLTSLEFPSDNSRGASSSNDAFQIARSARTTTGHVQGRRYAAVAGLRDDAQTDMIRAEPTRDVDEDASGASLQNRAISFLDISVRTGYMAQHRRSHGGQIEGEVQDASNMDSVSETLVEAGDEDRIPRTATTDSNSPSVIPTQPQFITTSSSPLFPNHSNPTPPLSLQAGTRLSTPPGSGVDIHEIMNLDMGPAFAFDEMPLLFEDETVNASEAFGARNASSDGDGGWDSHPASEDIRQAIEGRKRSRGMDEFGVNLEGWVRGELAGVGGSGDEGRAVAAECEEEGLGEEGKWWQAGLGRN